MIERFDSFNSERCFSRWLIHFPIIVLNSRVSSLVSGSNATL